MIEEIGTVVELKNDGIAVILCQKSSFCEHCSAAGVCHVDAENSSRTVDVKNPVNAAVGDQVRIATTTRSYLQSSFLLYIVPLIALVIGAVAGQLLGEWLDNGIDPNLLAAVLGTSFMVASFLVIRVSTLTLRKEDYMPRIVEILGE